jgi:proteinaceous RNase P
VCETTAEVVEAWFRSDAAAAAGVEKWDAGKVRKGVVKGGGGWHGQGWLGKGQWDVRRSEMDKNGKCQGCGEKLVCIDIDPSETETFAKLLTELACKREVRENFPRFQVHCWSLLLPLQVDSTILTHNVVSFNIAPF